MKRSEKLNAEIVELFWANVILMTVIIVILSGCGKFESDDFGVGDCIHSEHVRSDIVVKVVNHTSYRGWIVETTNGDTFTVPFNTPDLRKVSCE